MPDRPQKDHLRRDARHGRARQVYCADYRCSHGGSVGPPLRSAGKENRTGSGARTGALVIVLKSDVRFSDSIRVRHIRVRPS